MILTEQFTPFFGLVEDVMDPLESGRVRVRVFVYNTDNKGILPTDSLRWFMCVNSNTASLSGNGQSATGYQVGSLVFGFYIDEDRVNGIILGSLSGVGDFNDLSDIARGKPNGHIDAVKSATRTSIKGASWKEPNTPYAPKYPHNHTKVTPAGHVIEVDDTAGAERIKVYHKSGSMVEMHPDGTVVMRVKKDSYTLVSGDQNTCVDGNVSTSQKALEEYVDTTVHRKSLDKQHYDAPNIDLGEAGSLEPIVLGDKLRDWINNKLVPYINDHKHISKSPGDPTSECKLGPQGPFSAGSAAPGGAVYSKKNRSQ